MRLQIGIDPIVLSAEVSLSMPCVPPGYCTVIIGLFSAVAAATYKRQETAICFFPDHTFFFTNINQHSTHLKSTQRLLSFIIDHQKKIPTQFHLDARILVICNDKILNFQKFGMIQQVEIKLVVDTSNMYVDSNLSIPLLCTLLTY